jgi:hypothetical protein
MRLKPTLEEKQSVRHSGTQVPWSSIDEVAAAWPTRDSTGLLLYCNVTLGIPDGDAAGHHIVPQQRERASSGPVQSTGLWRLVGSILSSTRLRIIQFDTRRRRDRDGFLAVEKRVGRLEHRKVS